ncbi:ribonuclease H-like domain-containing protein [Tanacetum coccineum]
MHDPREPYFSALKRILRYIQGTLDYGLQLFSSTTDSSIAYSDDDWAGCPTTRWSTSGYCVFLGNNLLSWSSKRQPPLSRSSAEVEYRGVANAIAKTCWIQNLLHELHTPLSSATIVYCDNVRVLHVPSRFQYADIFTKGLPSALFDEFRDSLSVRWHQKCQDPPCIYVSIMASESAFSTCRRVLDPYRTSLTTQLVEALLCTQDWIRMERMEINVDEIEDFLNNDEVVKEMEEAVRSYKGKQVIER